MATTAQIQQFTQTWAPAANAASAALNIPSSFILSQWGMETGWGTQASSSLGMGKNNPGNIMDANGKPVNFNNPQDFVNEYVASMRGDFQALHNPKTQPKYDPVLASPWIYIQEIFGGGYVSGMPYSTSATSSEYASSVSGAYNTLVKAIGKGSGDSLDNYLHGKGTAMISVTNPSNGTSTNVPDAVNSGIASALSGLTSSLQRAGIVLVGGVLVVIGVLLLVKKEVIENVNPLV